MSRAEPGRRVLWRSTLSLAFVLLFAGAIIAIRLRVGDPGPLDASRTSLDATPTLSSPVPAGPLLGEDGKAIMLTPPKDAVAKVSEDEAVKVALQHTVGDATHGSVDAVLALYAGNPAWVVTIGGLCTEVSGGPPDQSGPACPITSETIIINSDSGEWAETYWGNADGDLEQPSQSISP